MMEDDTKKRIAIFSIFTGNYSVFYKQFAKSIEFDFLPDCDKHFFICADKKLKNVRCARDKVTQYIIDDMPFPYITLLRYKIFNEQINDAINDYDYVFFLNSNARCSTQITCSDINLENDYTFTLHDTHFNESVDEKPFERNTISTACFSNSWVNPEYVGGRFFGAKPNKFKEMFLALEKNVEIDLENDFISVWHDESHLNWYYNTHKENLSHNLLSVNYHVQEQHNHRECFTDKKIWYVDKNKRRYKKMFGKKKTDLQPYISSKLLPYTVDYHDNDISIEHGVNIITHYDSFGVGQHGYYFEKIFIELRIPYNLIKLGRFDSFETNMKTVTDKFNYRYLFVISAINADNPMYIDNLNLSDKYIKIGHWAWELNKFPYTHLDNTLDEIWSISNFSSSSINRIASNKVVNIQPPCLPISREVGQYGQKLVDEFDLDNKIVFSTFYDEKSDLNRKNPFVLLDIFLENEFEDKVLIVKSIGDVSEKFKKYKNKNIIFISDNLDYSDLVDIYKISDVYVSTAKSEGQGRSIMESLQCGTKVFAVNYSAIREFNMNHNITFIKHTLELVDSPIYGKYIEGIPVKWATMEKEDLFKNINQIQKKIPTNQNSISWIEKTYSVAKCATIVGKRLHSLKKKYIEKLIFNKLKLKPDYTKSHLLYKDIRGNQEKVVKRFKSPASISKYSYMNDDVVDLLNEYCIDFKNENKEYFSVDQSEEINFVVYKQRRCVFTTSNIKYISRVNLLAKSILKNHGDIDIYNVIVDDYSNETKEYIRSLNLPFIPIFLDELDINKVRNLKWFLYQYDAQNSNTAAKPFAFKLLFERGYQQVLYFDCDIEVYDSLDSLYEKLDFNSFVLTPHFTEPLPDYDGASPVDNIVNRCGQFNLGFIGISSKKSGCKFVEYWCQKTKNKFGVDLVNGIFTDQVWCNLIPSFYCDYYIERSFAYNIAYWNLSHRDCGISYENDKPYINGQPVVFVHYSGVVIEDKTVLSKHQNVLEVEMLNFQKLQNTYIDNINREIESYSELIQPTNNFDFYDDGTEIKDYQREHILNLTDEEFRSVSEQYENPFDGKIKEYYNTIYHRNLSMEDLYLFKNRPFLAYNFVSKRKFDNWKSKNK